VGLPGALDDGGRLGVPGPLGLVAAGSPGPDNCTNSVRTGRGAPSSPTVSRDLGGTVYYVRERVSGMLPRHALKRQRGRSGLDTTRTLARSLTRERGMLENCMALPRWSRH
jgi:hypothetical protein